MSESKSSSGLKFSSVLFLIFLVLKLTDVIDWSWWYVTLPLWGGFVFWMGIALIGILFISISKLFK